MNIESDQERWDRKYQEHEPSDVPSAVIRRLAEWLPRHGTALDLAGGGGRHAIWLAQRGLDVTVADISSVGLQIAERRAAAQGVTLQMRQVDLANEPLPTGPWSLIASCCYLDRRLFAEFPRQLAEGGVLFVLQPTMMNLIRHERPPREYLLQDGELARLVMPLKILHAEEGWLDDGRHDAVVIAQRAPVSAGTR